MNLKLTKANIDAHCHTDDRRTVYWDTELPGFGLVVGQRAKTFVVQRDVRGRSVRVTIGRYGVFTPDMARRRAREIIVEMASGSDPNEEKRKRDRITLAQAVEMHEARMQSKERRPRSIEMLREELERHLGDWMNRPLADIAPEDCVERHRRITQKSGGYVANRVMRQLRCAYNTARRLHRDLPDHPVAGVDMNPEYRRREPISWDELPDWYAQVQGLSNPVRRDLAIFTLLTGLRRRDAASVRWQDVDFQAGTLHRPDPKGGPDRAFTIPVSTRVLNILRARRVENAALFGHVGGDAGFVFPTVSRGGLVTYVQESKEHRYKRDGKGGRRKLSELPSPHRLRDTFITAAHEAGVDPLALKMLVNHSFASRDVTDGYKRLSGEYLRQQQERVTAFLEEKLEPKLPQGVVRLHGAGRI